MQMDPTRKYKALWDSSADTPDIAEFLEAQSDASVGERFQIVLIDQAYRWRTENPLTVENYLALLPALENHRELKLELVLGEFRARQQLDDSHPSIDEYTSRFGDLSDSLREKLSRLSGQDSNSQNDPTDQTGSFQSNELGELRTEDAGEEPTQDSDQEAPQIELQSDVDFDAESVTATQASNDNLVYRMLGRYRLDRVLGEGAFARVYLAYDEQLRREVAIKLPKAERFKRPEDADLYLAEARTVASLNHPNIVPVYDTGKTDEGIAYVVSRFVEGLTLAERIKHDRPSPEEAANLVAKVASALDYAHQQRLIHRDVKPGNILLEGEEDNPFVADFGLAIRQDEYLESGQLAGTPAYMSPEQVRGEDHRLDGRSDIFSLGVVLYELLTGKKPFRAKRPADLFRLITCENPKSPCSVDASVPVELERICLKCLAKRASERYVNAAELAEDLRQWKLDATAEAADGKQVAVVPRGLRAFTAEDSDFFVGLLPGPRNRQGLPESIQFWKKRLEEPDADKTFSVGLIYGPSGCGKSSLMRAGLLPRLTSKVTAVYVEATTQETEARILAALRKQVPELPKELGLVESFSWLRRRDEGSRIVVILDQFEQWLAAHAALADTELVAAARQANGAKLQVLLMVRDDFVMAAARFIHALDASITQGENFLTVDLFDLGHAQEVLVKFGQAYGKLPENGELSTGQEEFVRSAVAGLANEEKVVSVRLALFAEMVKGKSWEPDTLEEVGGTEGIGVNFLEETFSSRSANPLHRLHQAGAREVLKALLPGVGSDIKGRMRSSLELRQASGYQEKPIQEFRELLRILDSELRLITPTDPEGEYTPSKASVDSQFYQLTHDYLVPSLRQWLTRKQMETRKGRAQLKLAERADLWNSKQEQRHLPSLTEWMNIRVFTKASNWTDAERRMMRRADRSAGITLGLTFGLLLTIGITSFYIRHLQREKQDQSYAQALVSSLATGNTATIGDLLTELGAYERWVRPQLEKSLGDQDANSKGKRHARLFLVQRDVNYLPDLLPDLLLAQPDEIPLFLARMASHRSELLPQLWAIVASGSKTERIRAVSALAQLKDLESPEWQSEQAEIIAALLSVPASESKEWISLLEPAGQQIVHSLASQFQDQDAPKRVDERAIMANALASFLRDAPDELIKHLLIADDTEEFCPLAASLQRNTTAAIPKLQKLLGQSPKAESSNEESDQFLRQQANAAVCLLVLGEGASVWPLFELVPDPSLRSFVIDRLARLGAESEELYERLKIESDADKRYALILSLGLYESENMSEKFKEDLFTQVARIYREDSDAAVHSAAGWALRQWQQSTMVGQIDLEEKRRLDAQRDWFVNSQGQSFAVVSGPHSFVKSEITGKPGAAEFLPVEATLNHSFAIGTHEITNEQLRRFDPTHFRANAYQAENFESKPELPANAINAAKVAFYCNWLNEQEGIPREEWCYKLVFSGPYPVGYTTVEDPYSRTGYRMPTFDEWICACYAGTSSSYSYGEPAELMGNYAWYVLNSENHIWPPGLKMPNNFGLFDMHGNLWELCHDDFVLPEAFQRPDIPMRTYKVLAGSGYRSEPQNMQSNDYPSGSQGGGGFRLARTIRNQ